MKTAFSEDAIKNFYCVSPHKGVFFPPTALSDVGNSHQQALPFSKLCLN